MEIHKQKFLHCYFITDRRGGVAVPVPHRHVVLSWRHAAPFAPLIIRMVTATHYEAGGETLGGTCPTALSNVAAMRVCSRSTAERAFLLTNSSFWHITPSSGFNVILLYGRDLAFLTTGHHLGRPRKPRRLPRRSHTCLDQIQKNRWSDGTTLVN